MSLVAAIDPTAATLKLMKIGELLKKAWLQLLLLAIPFLVLLPFWNQFPARVPIHWGLSGKADGWADKNWGLLLMPGTNLALAVLTAIVPSFDTRVRSYSPEIQLGLQQATRAIRLAITGFLAGLALLIDALSLGWKFDFTLLLNLGMLGLFAITGNSLPKLPPNRFIGIRTPWTRKSPEVWVRTHQAFGPIMSIGSLAMMPVCFLVPTAGQTLVVVGFITLVALLATIYSYSCYRSLSRGD